MIDYYKTWPLPSGISQSIEHIKQLQTDEISAMIEISWCVGKAPSSPYHYKKKKFCICQNCKKKVKNT